jgi:hypothetical protein
MPITCDVLARAEALTYSKKRCSDDQRDSSGKRDTKRSAKDVAKEPMTMEPRERIPCSMLNTLITRPRRSATAGVTSRWNSRAL